jgi:hypothetical protein
MIKDGKYHLTKRPYMEGYTMLDAEIRTIPIEIKEMRVYGKNKKTGETESFSIHHIDPDKVIIDPDPNVVIKKKLREVTKLRNEVKSYLETVMSDLDVELKAAKYFENLEDYPEVLI